MDTQCNGQIKNAYELAGQMDDLNLGDCLIIPVLDPDNLSLREKKISVSLKYNLQYIYICVCMYLSNKLVVQMCVCVRIVVC
ncbi:unnamed protein product [Trichobilharzia regenti]|nr:unnamed protein product [Trichobilharzia regenti]